MKIKFVRCVSNPRQQRGARGTAAALTLSMCLSAPAVAADWQIGLAAGSARGRVDCVATFPCDRSDVGGKLSLAYRFAPAFDAQLAYLRGGRFDGGGTTPLGNEFGGAFDVDAIGLTVGYRWSITPLWSALARLGVASVHAKFEYANPAFGSSGKTSVQPLLGLGVAYQVSPALSVGLDYDATRIKAHTSHGSLQMLGIAAQLSF
ncbi:MAG: outer membrane beta-barrel protein [Caldimonas sp.]